MDQQNKWMGLGTKCTNTFSPLSLPIFLLTALNAPTIILYQTQICPCKLKFILPEFYGDDFDNASMLSQEKLWPQMILVHSFHLFFSPELDDGTGLNFKTMKNG